MTGLGPLPSAPLGLAYRLSGFVASLCLPVLSQHLTAPCTFAEEAGPLREEEGVQRGNGALQQGAGQVVGGSLFSPGSELRSS